MSAINPAPSLEQLKNAARGKPKDPNIHRDYGRALFAAGFINEAIRELKKAIRINPIQALFHNDLGACLLHSGNSDEATRHLIGLEARHTKARNSLELRA